MENPTLKDIQRQIQDKKADLNNALAKAERLEEQLKILRIREANITGIPYQEGEFELDISDTVETVELKRLQDRGHW